MDYCDIWDIHTFHSYINSFHDNTTNDFEVYDEVLDDSILSETLPPSLLYNPSEEESGLISLRQQRIESVFELKAIEERKQQLIDEYEEYNQTLQARYKQTKSYIQELANQEMDTE